MFSNVRICVVVVLSMLLRLSQAQVKPESNPLLVHTAAPILFDQVKATHINQAVLRVKEDAEKKIKVISDIPAASRSHANTLMAFDELGYELSEILMRLSLIAATYVDDSIRNRANEASAELSLYANNLYLNKGLYKSLKDFASSSAAKQLKPNHQKFLRENILLFEKNGMKLDDSQAAELKKLNEKLVNFGIAFDRNIAEHRDSIVFSEEALAGIKEITKNPWKRANGSYVVYINGPAYTEIMSNASKPETRKQMFLKYNNRAYPQNLVVLDSLLYYRKQFASLLGFNSFAAYALVDKMAKTPATVWNFEYDLVSKLTPLVTTEIAELTALKRKLDPGTGDTLYEFDLSYYRKKLLDTRYQLNTDEVREYFEMNNTLKGMFSVYEKLFNLSIKEVANVPLWHEKVRAYEMYKDGGKIGNFYLDLFPRPDKYTHFACFPISQYSSRNGKTLLPVSALVCNFPEGDATQPSLLYHSDVVTLFHEFGHLVHSMLGRSDISQQGPFAVKGDFVEAPSQLLENWVWEYEPLRLFAKHHKTGEVLPESLFKKMKGTQNVGSGNFYMRQVHLGMIDFTFEDKYDSIRGKNLVEVAKDLMKIRQIPFVEGSHFITSFGHLNSYAANYYGYLWSKVFAEDMFSVFKKNGVMDRETGIKYRKEVLEKGSTKEELNMLRSFLGREPNSEAFMRSIGARVL
jgi:Zn-dependent oligopeptidase